LLKPIIPPLAIVKSSRSAPLSKDQKTFNTLIRQIEQGRARLAAWEAAIPRYQQKHAAEFQPLLANLRELHAKLVHALDQTFEQVKLNKTERRKVSALITQLTEELLATDEDEAIKALYNKHSGSDYDESLAEDQATLKDAVEHIFGIDLGEDVDLNSPEDFMKHAEAKLHERHAAKEAAQEAREQRQAQRKKSPKQLEKEAREQADAQQLRQSLREIYRKLASALHPDRETDPQERERKTLLMQRLNQAYDKNNLLQMLELQLELEQIDQNHINNVSAERLKHYNKILREQLAELHHEILRVESGFLAQYMFDPYDDPTPDTLLHSLAADITAVRLDIRDRQRDLAALDDVKTLKVWLKGLRMSKRRPVTAPMF
jgi:hypothetical protein